MSKSYLKSRLYEQLKLHGHVPDLDEDTDPDTWTSPSTLCSRILGANVLSDQLIARAGLVRSCLCR